MGFLQRLGHWIANDRQDAASSVQFDENFLALLERNRTASGVNITWETALQVSTALRCASLIAEGICSVPWKLQRSVNGNHTEDRAHPLWDLINSQPNDYQTSFEFRETIGLHLALCSNAYVFLNRVRGRIVEMLPLMPGSVEPRQKSDWSVEYRVTFPDGTTGILPQSDVWHLKSKAWNSVKGVEVLKLAREALGLSLAIERSQAASYKNGVRSSGVFSVDDTMDEAQFKKFRKLIEFQYAGSANTGKPILLDRAAKFESMSMKASDQQTIETRGHEIEEVCRNMGVLPIMVGHSGEKAATYASAEQMMIAHVRYTVMPWHRRVQQSGDRWLLTKKDRAEGYYTRFVDADLLRGDHKTMAEYYSIALGGGRQPGWLTVNEVRAFEDLNAIPGMDRLYMPVNTAPIGDDGRPMMPENVKSVAVDTSSNPDGSESNKVTLSLA